MFSYNFEIKKWTQLPSLPINYLSYVTATVIQNKSGNMSIMALLKRKYVSSQMNEPGRLQLYIYDNVWIKQPKISSSIYNEQNGFDGTFITLQGIIHFIQPNYDVSKYYPWTNNYTRVIEVYQYVPNTQTFILNKTENSFQCKTARYSIMKLFHSTIILKV